MNTTIELIAGALQADAQGLRVIGQNIANSQSVAYRREIPVTQTTFEQAAAAAAVRAAGIGQGVGAAGLGAGMGQSVGLGQGVGAGQAVSAASTGQVASGANAGHAPTSGQGALDLTPGTLQSTASPLNVAIEGSGFFVISTSKGEVLTRRGDFRLDGSGQVVTQAGDPVLGTSGPIVINGGSPTISPDGTVRVGTETVGQLRVVDVGSGSALAPVGNSSYILTPGEQAIDSPAPTVRQGFLETSNVQTVNEMVQLMDTLRRFEAGQHFVRGYDDMVDKAITTLGKI
jgi:flagellar basal-body rod protein FlgF